jgi:hypothetical protein
MLQQYLQLLSAHVSFHLSVIAIPLHRQLEESFLVVLSATIAIAVVSDTGAVFI